MEEQDGKLVRTRRDYFKTNIDALYDFMKKIKEDVKEEGDDNDNYAKAEKWLQENGFFELYLYLSKKTIVGDDDDSEELKKWIPRKRTAVQKGCFVVEKSAVKVNGITKYEPHAKLYENLGDFFKKLGIEKEHNIFLCEDNSYAFNLGVENGVKNARGRDVLTDTNYELIKRLISYWTNKKTQWSEEMEFKDYVFSAVVLKSLIPPFYIVNDRTKKIKERYYADYKTDYELIDYYLYGYYKKHAVEEKKKDLEKLNEKMPFYDYDLSQYKKILYALTDDKEFGMDFVNSMTALRGIDEEKYREIMRGVYNHLFENVNIIAKKAKGLAVNCMEQRDYLDKVSNFEYIVDDVLEDDSQRSISDRWK